MTKEAVKKVKEYNPDEIVLLPLYPQFSTTTTGSSMEEWDAEAKKAGLDKKTYRICCYPQNKGFIEASARLLKTQYLEAIGSAEYKKLPKPRILFSAHGLPEDIIEEGDPYQRQTEQTAEKIAGALDLPGLDWAICYQSKVGPKKWIGPSLDEELNRAAKDGVPVIIYTHAFVSEHVETLVEIDIEYKEEAEKLGIPYFLRASTVMEEIEFVSGLAEMVEYASQAPDIICKTSGRPCDNKYNQCYLRQYK
jgi:ferrochelatase